MNNEDKVFNFTLCPPTGRYINEIRILGKFNAAIDKALAAGIGLRWEQEINRLREIKLENTEKAALMFCASVGSIQILVYLHEDFKFMVADQREAISNVLMTIVIEIESILGSTLQHSVFKEAFAEVQNAYREYEAIEKGERS